MNKVEIKGEKPVTLMRDMKYGQIAVIESEGLSFGEVVIRIGDTVGYLSGFDYWDHRKGLTLKVRILPPGTEITITVGD
jgi:hypothetical protein